MGKWLSEHVWGQLIVGVILLLCSRVITNATAEQMATSASLGLQKAGLWWTAETGISNGSVVLIALSLIALFGFLTWRQRRAPSTVKPAEVNEAPARVISAMQQEILAFFWVRDAGKRFSVKTLEMHIGRTSNEVQHGLDGLIEHDYLSDSLDALTGRSYFLNEKGRKLCAELFTTTPPTTKA